MTELMQGYIGDVIDKYGTLHKNCIVVKVNVSHNLVCFAVYSPNFHESFLCKPKDFKSNGNKLDKQTRKMNVEYANQHKRDQLISKLKDEIFWSWSESDADVSPLS